MQVAKSTSHLMIFGHPVLLLAHVHRSAAMQQARQQSEEKETRDCLLDQQPFSSLTLETPIGR